MLKVTKSINLISYLRCEGVDIDIKIIDDGILVGTYESTYDTEIIKERYRNDVWLHEYLNNFKELKTYAKKCRIEGIV